MVVHTDDARFPDPKHRSMYAFLYTERGRQMETSINACYRFQPGVSGRSPLLGTQHPNFDIRADGIRFDRVFRTPIFDFESVRTIPELRSLNGELSTYYCGSHFGHGLHEDAVRSAVDVAVALGAE